MADSANVTLTYSATSITIPGPRDSQQDPRPRHATDLAAGGTRWVYKLAATIIDEWTLNFDYLSLANKIALQNFFNNTVEGPTQEFTYTHTDGKAYSVRFKDVGLRFKRRNAEDWSTSFTLEVVNDVIE